MYKQVVETVVVEKVVVKKVVDGVVVEEKVVDTPPSVESTVVEKMVESIEETKI